MANWVWDKKFAVDDEEDGEDDDGGYYRGKNGNRDALIFLIDCSESMFEKNDEDSAFERCIKCAKSVIQNKIISSENDLLGIAFFGTEKEKNDVEAKHVYVFHELQQPGAETVLQLDSLLEDPTSAFFDENGRSTAYSIGDAFWTCSAMFAKCLQKLAYKRIMLFTNNDNPHRESVDLKRYTATRADDLNNNGIGVELLHMNRPGREFDVNAFYKDTLVSDEDETAVFPHPSEKFEDLLTRVRYKDHKKRTLTRIPLSFGKDFNFSVGVYSLVRKCTAPPSVKLYTKTNEEIKAVTKTFLQSTGEILLPQDMKKCQVYAGKKILFENEEVMEMKKIDQPGLKLMGFKPRSCLKKYHHIRPGQFLYPDETTIEGSTCMFTAMLTKCLEKDIVAICRYIPRKNSAPRFVALLPQAEELDEINNQVTPPGFTVIFLPYADDIRKVPKGENLTKANTDQIDKAKEIIKKLQFQFKSDNFENPCLQTYYAGLEAMALDLDTPDEITDYTEPNTEQMDKRAGRLISEFKDLVYPEGYDPEATIKKRSQPAGGGPAAKKPKPEMVDIDLKAEAKAGRLNKLTVTALKEGVKKLKIKTAGTKKAELVEAINDHFGV